MVYICFYLHALCIYTYLRIFTYLRLQVMKFPKHCIHDAPEMLRHFARCVTRALHTRREFVVMDILVDRTM